MKRALLILLFLFAAPAAYSQGGGLPAHEAFRLSDPNGWGMAVLAMSVVFAILAVLAVAFKWVGIINVRFAHRRHSKTLIDTRYLNRMPGQAAAAPTVPAAAETPEVLSGEIVAAIGLAMKMYHGELHDHESTLLTINRVAKVYSPWNSKIYIMRNMPQKRR